MPKKSKTQARETRENDMYTDASQLIQKMRSRLGANTYASCENVFFRVRQHRNDLQCGRECKALLLSIVQVDKETHDCLVVYLQKYETLQTRHVIQRTELMNYLGGTPDMFV